MLALGRLVAARAAQMQRLFDPRAHAMQVASGQHVVEHAHAPEQRNALERARNAAQRRLMRMHALSRGAVEAHRPLLRPVDAIDHVQQRALARAVRTDQRTDFALMDIEADIRDRAYPAERKRYVFERQKRLARGGLMRGHGARRA